MPAAMAGRLDEVLSLKAFAMALAGFFVLLAAVFVVAGLNGIYPASRIEKTASLTTEKTVPVKSGDLNQLDLTAPPPKTAIASPAQQPQSIENATQGLTENSTYGLIPIVRKTDGLTPFKSYAAAFTPDPTAKALISFVMVDFGLSQKNSASGLSQLPQNVSFALNPYAKAAQKWTSDARKSNHEVWLSLPLQAPDYPETDTGPKTILAAMSADDAGPRILQTLATATGYAGIVVDNAAAFEAYKPALQKTLSGIADRGLGIAQSDPADKIIGALAAQTKAPYAQADAWIDQVNSDKDLQTKFIGIEASAVKNKKLIVFFLPYPATIKAVADWSKQASARGVQLAPLSAVMAK